MKRPWLMAAWPLLLLFYCSSTLTKVAQCSRSKNNDARLKVSIRKDTMLGVPSCQHTFSQIELLNLHSTEAIMIHSIQTIPEETVLVRPDSTPTSSPSSNRSSEPAYGRSWKGKDIPQQLHVSRLPSGSLSLGPGQVAIVPVTFLPRYPSIDNCGGDEASGFNENNDEDNARSDDYYSTTVPDGRSPPPLSSTSKLDLVDLVGERVLKAIDNKRQYLRHTLDPTYRRRNNMNPSSLPKGDEQYEVTTTVIVDTSRGVVKLPISASSIRDNLYRIPDVITFYHPSVTKNDNDKNTRTEEDDEFDDYDTTTAETRKKTTKSNTEHARLTTMNGVTLFDTIHASDNDGDGDEKNNPASLLDTIKPERECFDLYLSNPFPDRELQVMEALISRPEFVSVQFDPVRMAAPDLTMLVGSGPSQVLRQWTVDGPLYLPPDSDKQYILTICTAFEGEIEPDEGSETYLDEMSKWIDSGDPDKNLGFLQIRTDAETLFVGLEHAENVPFLSLQPSTYNKNLSSDVSAGSGTDKNRSGSSTLLKSFPDRLKFDMISTASRALHTSFGLQNKSPVPIRIMRVTVGIDSSGDEENAREAKLIGLKLKIGLKGSNGKVENSSDDSFDNALGSLILGAASSLDDVLELKCSLNPDRYFSDSNKESFNFMGTVVIRGTMDTELSYHQWREETLQNPYRDEHLTLELPFTVTILNGRVEALIEQSSHPYPQLFAAQSWDGSGRAISHLFFPMNQYAAVKGTEDVLPQQMYLGANEIRHDLRILSNMLYPLTFVGVKIIDDDNPNNLESLCNRFNVSIVQQSNPGDPYFGFEEIGFIVLKYKFEVKGKRGGNQDFLPPRDAHPYLPKQCSLIVLTTPEEAGTYKIPLLIFPGHLEVSLEDSSSVGFHKGGEDIIGFNRLLSWCRSSRLGKSFFKNLKSPEDRRKLKGDSDLLSKFLAENSGWDPKLKPKLLPFLLKVGAVDGGKIAKTHISLTNHNPIPLTVSIDVGEVEGMSIAFSRDASQVAGDGNSLHDYLPKQAPPSTVQVGKYEGHPVTGLLNFLKSNKQAHEFNSKFKFRDSISPHDLAMERSDVLRLLHDWHSKASFHRGPISSQSNSKNSTNCEDNVQPPQYKPFSFNNFTQRSSGEGLPGAFIVSSNGSGFRPLAECWRRNPDEMSADRNTIKIPPGAMARFEIQVRAPSPEFLENDITHFLMSGLKLSTNLGDVMPVFAIVEALQGKLHASQIESDEHIKHIASKSLMSVPLELMWNSVRDGTERQHADVVTIPPANSTASIRSDKNITYFLGDASLTNGVPLYLRSSFSRNVRLLRIDSCHPWFTFVPLTKGVEHPSGNGVLVGLIRSNVDCSSNHTSAEGFPSFYQCMLNWLSLRSKLQSEGCGVRDANPNLRQVEGVQKTIEAGLRRLKKHHETHVHNDPTPLNFRALSFWNETDLSHIKSGRRKNDGLIADFTTYDAMWKAIQIADNFGYNLLSSSLRATVEYDSDPLMSTPREGDVSVKQNLSLSINDLNIQSVLKAPKLFDGNDDYFEFQPTTVGSVASVQIPVRNPTGVPVRIRIGTSVGKDESFRTPYVQNGKSSVPSNESSSFSWWDGYGAFFIPDEHGNVIQSHNNISVTGGSGTTSISMVNPSLNSQLGLLVGCGKRCGLRDKTSAKIPPISPVSNSPIGSSAAAGIILKGHFRYNSPERNNVQEEPIILAGGAAVSNTDGPAAFAIPFSALDEIIIPPFGKGHLGPIYFRPPGRYKTVGCQLAKESGAKLDERKEMLCKTQIYDSFLYLENSLTGIEKVRLRGRSAWENLYFVDPPPKEGEDAFGDIEFRNGMPTLIFSGTSNRVGDFSAKATTFRQRIQHLSVVKEVVLHNGGDNDSYIENVSLWGMNDDREENGSCSYGSFKLVNCWTFIPDGINAAVNIHSGFVLKPGESRSIFVEHLPDCKRKKEYITLRVQLRRDKLPRASKLRRSRSRGLKNPFATKEKMMFLGYEMSGPVFGRCLPIDTRLMDSLAHLTSTSMNLANYSGRMEFKKSDESKEESPLLMFQVFLFSAAALILCYALCARFRAILCMLQKIQGATTKNDLNWNAAFRCLARSQPTSMELQTMSREQMRQDVISRYKARGNTTTSTLNSTNCFSRDRRAAISNTLRHRIGKEASPGNERTRPFSDALFHDASTADDSSLRAYFPIGLGWRTAYSRGIVKDNSLLSTTFVSRTKVLLNERAKVSMARNTKNSKDKSDHEEKGVVKSSPAEERKESPSSSLSRAEVTNVIENEETKIVVVQNTDMVSKSKQKEIETPSKPKTNHFNDSKNIQKINKNQRSERVRSPGNKSAENATTYTRKVIPSKHSSKTEKQSVKKKELPIQPSKNTPTADLSKRNEKPRNQVPKTNDQENPPKKEKVSKNAPWGQNPKPKVPAKSQSALLGPLPKSGTPTNAWQPEREKATSTTASSRTGKKETIQAEKKSKAKDKSKKKTNKQSPPQGKKPDSNPAIKKKVVSEVSIDTVSPAKEAQRTPTLNPPPGFGNINPSRNDDGRLHSVPSTDSQLSLEAMLRPSLAGGPNDADIALGAPLQASSSSLSFARAGASASGSDFYFSASLRDPNPTPSPPVHGLGVAEAPGASEPPGGLGHPTDEPWLHPLVADEAELADQPWLPALLNQDDGDNNFDVMDFLDGILQDGSPSGEEPSAEQESFLPPLTHTGMVPGGQGTTAAAATMLVSENPWARESRAAAYGISFDEEDDNASKTPEMAGGLGNIPLLSPAAILNAEENTKNGGEEDEKVLSFYAGLLDE